MVPDTGDGGAEKGREGQDGSNGECRSHGVVLLRVEDVVADPRRMGREQARGGPGAFYGGTRGGLHALPGRARSLPAGTAAGRARGTVPGARLLDPTVHLPLFPRPDGRPRPAGRRALRRRTAAAGRGAAGALRRGRPGRGHRRGSGRGGTSAGRGPPSGRTRPLADRLPQPAERGHARCDGARPLRRRGGVGRAARPAAGGAGAPGSAAGRRHDHGVQPIGTRAAADGDDG